MLKIKVLHILEEGRYGGVHRRVVEIARHLRKYDVDSIVILPKSNSVRLQAELSKYQIDFNAINLNRLTLAPIGLLKYVIFFIPEVWGLYHLICKNKPCLVHANGAYQIKGIIASKLAGVQNVWHLNDTYSPKPVRMVFSLIGRYCTSSFIAAANRTQAYYLNDKSWNQLVTKLNEPVDCEYFTSSRRNTLDEVNIINVTVIGNVSEVKGIEIFIKMAIELNREQDANFQFNIVGELLSNKADYIKELKELITSSNATNIVFHGAQKDIRSVLQQADIYVCSSFYESSPMSIWEAMSMKLPIVSTDVGDVKEIIERNTCGFIAATGDFDMLSKHVLSYVRNPQLAEKHANKARQVALREFDVDLCVRGHLQHYKKIWQH